MAVFSYTNLSTRERPGVRARVEQSRKRFQCELLQFWRECELPRCWQRHRCFGDPHDCFSRHHAAMPRDHAARPHADILSRTTGTGTAEQALRAFGLSLPAHVQPADAGLPRPQQTDGAMPAVASAQENARRRVDGEADIPSQSLSDSQSLSEMLAEVKKLLGVILTSKPEPEAASPAPSPRAEAEAPVVIPLSESRAAVEAFNERASKGMDYNDMMARLRALGAPV